MVFYAVPFAVVVMIAACGFLKFIEVKFLVFSGVAFKLTHGKLISELLCDCTEQFGVAFHLSRVRYALCNLFRLDAEIFVLVEIIKVSLDFVCAVYDVRPPFFFSKCLTV